MHLMLFIKNELCLRINVLGLYSLTIQIGMEIQVELVDKNSRE